MDLLKSEERASGPVRPARQLHNQLHSRVFMSFPMSSKIPYATRKDLYRRKLNTMACFALVIETQTRNRLLRHAPPPFDAHDFVAARKDTFDKSSR